MRRFSAENFNAGVDSLAQRFSDWLLDRMIRINGYHIAAVFMLMLLVGSATEPNNGVMLGIALNFPLLTPLFWNVVFVISAAAMMLNTNPLYEDVIAFFFFILPVTVFFGLLIYLTLHSGVKSTPYFIVMLTLACVFMINFFVARTRVFSWYQSELARARLEITGYQVENADLRQQLAKLTGSEATESPSVQ